jgi:zinc/manganese transport system substrate-binding protein
MRSRPRSAAALMTLGVALLASACTSSSAAGPSGSDTIVAVGAENEYANVIGQVGGKYVQVSAIMSNPTASATTRS